MNPHQTQKNKPNFSLLSKIKRDKTSFFLTFLLYIIIIFLIISYKNLLLQINSLSSLWIHEYLFSFSSLLLIWSHITCLLTNPGVITSELNQEYINFYLNIREFAIERGEILSKTHGKRLFSDENLNFSLSHDEDFSEDDDFPYDSLSFISETELVNMNKSLKVEFRRCDKCFIVRFPSVKHCNRCRGCVMSMDHHCPWVFNCIGQFNQKYFLQFLGYSLISLVDIVWIYVYVWFNIREM